MEAYASGDNDAGELKRTYRNSNISHGTANTKNGTRGGARKHLVYERPQLDGPL